MNEGGIMNKFISIGLCMMLGLASLAFSADRIVLVEEMYQES
jgi:hypothetical protein